MKKKKLTLEEELEEYMIKHYIEHFKAERAKLPKREFNPLKYIAKCCKSELQSKYPGQLVSCFCGSSYVDQTEYYTRCGGDVELAEQPHKSISQADGAGEDVE